VRTKSPRENKPISIKRGSVTVKIYQTTNSVNGKSYRQFSLACYHDGKRKTQRFSSLKEAKVEAELVATKLSQGQGDVLTLTSKDRVTYLQAIKNLNPTGRSLNAATEEYALAVTRLPSGISLAAVVDDYLHRNKSIDSKKTIADVVAEYINSKEKAGLSDRHIKDLRARLPKFGDATSSPLASLSARHVQTFLDNIEGTNRTRLNYLRQIVSLVRFAVRRKYAPRDLLDELDSVDRPSSRPKETEIFTPCELREMLTCAPVELLPWLVVAAFAGLRSAEILRLDWKNVDLKRQHIEVTAQNAKTASRRLVPLTENAIELLMPFRQAIGRMAYYSEENKFHASIVRRVNSQRQKDGKQDSFVWKRNGLRHSFCSYRLAVTQDAAKTALEAGNSPAMIFKHYPELVTPDQALEWFSVSPIEALGSIHLVV
jgi:integrase